METFKKNYDIVKNWYKPYKDYTNKVHLMKYCNNSMAYGCTIVDTEYNKKIVFHLIDTGAPMEATVNKIIYSSNEFESIRKRFFELKPKII